MSEKENIKIYHATYYVHKPRGICKTIRGEWAVEIPDLFEKILIDFCELNHTFEVRFSYLYDEQINLNVLAICSPRETGFSRKRAVTILRGRRYSYYQYRELYKDKKSRYYRVPFGSITNKWSRYICFDEVKQPKRDVK
jgi:hypothetical protein